MKHLQNFKRDASDSQALLKFCTTSSNSRFLQSCRNLKQYFNKLSKRQKSSGRVNIFSFFYIS